MSKEIDQKVVEMRFDNKHFEANVSTSISSLEKLKRSLDFKGASKSLESLDRSAKSVNMDPLGRSVDAIKNKFSALETVATGALLRIGSQIADVGMKFANAVTSMNSINLENITAGWSKFNDKNSAVATLVAQGYSLEKVNEQLDRLNWYTDETSYNFIDMVKSISKFTASGQDLEQSVDALEGIANWAALSGQNATVASAAMYQLSQAMGSGVMRKEDYKSVQNLSMDTVEFRQHALDAAVALGTLRKNADGTYHSLMATGKAITDFNINQFADHLTQDAWFTSDVMMKVYNEYAGAVDKVYRYAEAHGVSAHEAIEALGDELTEFERKAFEAAQEARSWADVVDSVKDAVSTGWTQTFEAIFGNYETSKGFFSQLAEDFWEIFASGATARNKLLSEALDTPWEKYSKEMKALAFDLSELNDEELKNAGYTREQADAIAELNQRILDGAPDLKEYIESLSTRPSGRENLMQSVYNIRDALFLFNEETDTAIGFIAVLKEAWSEVFPAKTAEQIYDMTKKLRDFTERLIPSEETADRLKRTFKGLFAVLDIGEQAISAAVRTISPLFKSLTGLKDGFLEGTATVGDWLVKLDEAIKEHDIFFHSLEKVTGILGTVANAIRSFAESVGQRLNLPSFSEFGAGLRALFDAIEGRDQEGLDRIREFIDRLKELDGFTLNNIKKVLADFKENVIGYFFDFGSTFDRMNTSVSGFGNKVQGALGLIGDYAEKAGVRVSGAANSFIDAFTKAANKTFETAIDFRSKLAEKIGFAEIFSIGLGTAIAVFTKKIADALGLLAAPFEGIEKILKSVAKSIKAFARVLKARALETQSKALKNISESILMLVGALALLTLLDQEKLKSAGLVLGIIAAGLLAFSFAMSKIGTPSESARLSASLLALGASLLSIASAMKKLDGLENIGKSFSVITALMAELLIVSKLIGSKDKKFSTGIQSLIGIALSLKILIGVIKDIDSMQIKNVGQTIGILAAAVAGLVALSAASKKMSLSAGAGILAMVVSLKLLVSSFKSLSKLDLGQTRTALQSFVAIFGMFGAVMLASNFAGKYASEAGSAVAKMSAALLLITLSFKMMEKIDPLALERTKKVVEELLAVFAVITAASRFSGEHAAKAGTMLLAMSGAILILSGAIGLLAIVAKYNPQGLSRALGAVEQLLAFFGGLVVLTRFAGQTEKLTGTMIAMSVAIGVMTAAVGAMTMLDPEKLRGSVTALSVLMTALGVMITATHFAKQAIGSLATMTVVVAGLAGILFGMGALHVENAIEKAAGLSILLTSMSAALLLLTKAGTIAPNAYAAIGVMTAVVAGLALILGLMGHFNVEPSIETAASLSIMLVAMSGACVILSKAGTSAKAAFTGLAALGTLIVGLGVIMAGISALTEDNPTIEEDLDRAVLVLEKIGTGLGAAIGGFVGGAIGGLSSGLPVIGTNLADFMTNVQPFFNGVKALDSDVVYGVKSLAEALAFITGAQLLEGLTSWVTGGFSMSEFADQLVPFGEGIVKFSDIVADIDPKVVTAAAAAGKALAEMAATIPNSGGLISYFTGENNMDDFAAQLVPFGKAIKAFSLEVDGLNTDAVDAAASAGNLMVQLANTIPNSGGLLGYLAGENNIDDFAAKLVPFGEAIKAFALEVEGIETDSVQNAAAAGAMMVELANTIPNSGGLISFFVGDNNIDDFGKGLISLGRALVIFSDSKISPNAVENTTKAGEMLVELGKTMPKSGLFSGKSNILDFGEGLLAFGRALLVFSNTSISMEAVQNAVDASDALVDLGKTIPYGNSNMTSFAEGLVPFGEAMAAFSAKVRGLSSSAVNGAVAAGKMITGLAETIPNSGGLAGLFAGNNDLADFSKQLVSFAEAISSFAESVKAIPANAADNVKTVGDAMVELAKTIPNSGGLAGLFAGNNDLNSFGAKISSFGAYIQDYYSSVSTINTAKFKDVTAAIQGLVDMAGSNGGMSGSFLSNMSAAFKELADTCIDAFEKGVKGRESSVKATISSLVTKTVSAINDKRSSFYSAGTNVGQGFVNGINSKLSDSASAGGALGRAALNAAKKALDSNSPSKEFMKVGEDSVGGLVTGIDGTIKNVAGAGERMGETLIDATRSALDSHSDSEETIKIGKDAIGGAVTGLKSGLETVKKVGAAVGTKIVNGVKESVSGNPIGGIVTDMLSAAGADVSNLNLDLFSTSKSATSAMAEEAKAASTVASSYQNATSAKKTYTQATQEAAKVTQEATKIYYAGYASEEYQYLATHLGEGLAIGLSNGIVKADQAISESIGEVMTMAGKGIETWEDWLSERKYYNKISLTEELAGWEKLQTEYAVGSENRQKVDREVYRVQNELLDATYQYSLDWIEKEESYDRMSTQKKLGYLKQVQARYMWGSEKRIEIDHKIYQLEKAYAAERYQNAVDYIDEEVFYDRMGTEQKLAYYRELQAEFMEGSEERKKINREVYQLEKDLKAESYQNSMDWIEKEKYYNRMSLADELAAYKRVQSRYAKGTEERKKMDREVYRVEQEIYEAQKQYIADVQSLQEEADKKREEAEKEYRDNCEATKEKLKSDIKELNDQYQNALNSRESSLYQSYGLFDEVKEREEVSGAKLLDNLQGQVEEFGEWQRTLDKLSARGIDAELLSELQQMGPAAISQIKALESMSDSELNRYVSLWSVKHAQARQQAVSELEGLRIETEQSIATLRADAEKQLKQYYDAWIEKQREINTDTETELNNLRRTFGEKVGLIKKDTEKEMREMVTETKKILSAAGWEETGQQMVNGLIEGIESRREALLDTITQLALDTGEAYSEPVEIKSPSRLFRRYGNYIVLGLINGIKEYANKASDTASELADSTREGFGDAIQTLSDYLTGDWEARPTIRPVLDLSDVASGTSAIEGMFYNQRMLALAGQTSFAFAANAGSSEMTITVDNDGVIRELRSLRGEMTEMTERMEHLQVVLDSGTLVGETAAMMDSALGQRQVYRGRGN